MPAPASNYTYTTFSAFQAYVNGMLGGNLVDIELTTQDYTNAYNKAKTVWFQRGNVNLNEAFAIVPVVTGQTVYDMSTYPQTIDSIIKMVIPSGTFYQNNPFSVSVFNEIFLGIINQGQMDVYTYEGTLQFIDLINLYTVAHPDYIWNRRTQQLTLLKAPTSNDNWFLHCYTLPQDEDLYNLLWVQEYTIAEAKHILGLAYQKFSQLQGPAGEYQLDGSALIQEALESKKELIENIADYVDSDEQGGYILLG